MKKTILIIFCLFSLIGFSQKTNVKIINAVTAGNSANFTYEPGNGRIGSIVTTTSAAYNGTTGTIKLYGSNDGENFTQLYANDGVTALSFTLGVSGTYVWQIQNVMFLQYQIVYTKGDASAGTITSNYTTR